MVWLLICLGIVSVGCGDGAKDSGGQVKASPTPAPAGAGERQAAKGGAGAITPENTKITWVGTKANGKHDGGFEKFSGTLEPMSGDISASKITLEIDTGSIVSDTPKLTQHLKSPDFFDVQSHPKAKFVSTAIQSAKGGEATHTITGDLTLHGKTKSVSIPAKVAATDSAVTINGTFTINRQDFAIKYGPGKVDDLVTIKVASQIARK
jgi:polyisoprenoid-binding protein YceI